MKTPVCFLISVAVFVIKPVLNAQEIAGTWYGRNGNRDSLHVTLHIYSDGRGLKASTDNPNQTIFGIMADEVRLSGDSLFYRIKDYDISFRGYVNPDNSGIRGLISQFGNTWKLDFGRKRPERIVPVDFKSLLVVPAKPKEIKVRVSQSIPYTGLRKINAGDRKKVKVDQGRLQVVTPGKGSAFNPVIYKFPEPVRNEYRVKSYYNQFAPVIVRARAPVTVQAQPMRMKDAASLNIKYLNTEQGLVYPYTESIMQDSKGNIWFSSSLGGICRYDGRNLFYYSDTERNTSLTEDSEGNIWIGFYEGLWKFDGRYFTKYPGEIFGFVNSMMVSRNGNLWVCTGNGAFEKRGDLWIHYTRKQGLLSNSVRVAIEDRHGHIWLGTSSGACEFDGESFTQYTQNEGLNSDNIRSMIVDRTGSIWFGTAKGVCMFDGKSIRGYTTDEGLSGNNITSLQEDYSGNIWIGTNGGGINMFDGSSFFIYTRDDGLSNNNITSITEDKSRNIWMTTSGSGIMKLRRDAFTFFSQFESKGQGLILSITEDSSGNIWSGIFGAGLMKFDGNSFTLFTDDEDLRDYNIRAVIADKSGNIWFTDDNNGLQRFDGRCFLLQEFGDYPAVPVQSLYEDPDGNLWLGTSTVGLEKFDGKVYTSFPSITGGGDVINEVIPDLYGNIWYSSRGLFRFDGKAITQYNTNEGLSDNEITALCADKKDNLWIGTLEHGMNRLFRDSITYFSKRDGLTDDHVKSVIDDSNGNIWIGTSKGLSMLSPDGNGSYTVNIIGAEDDLKNLSFNNHAVCLDSKNRLWWGNGGIITMLDLNNFKINAEKPVIQINDVLINQKYIDFGALLAGEDQTGADLSGSDLRANTRGLRFSEVAPFYNYPFDLRLSHRLDHVTIYFSAISWPAPQGIRYQFMLEGMEKEWGQLTRENKADYRNIPAGKYIFRVKALSRANVWSETLEYPFVVKPPLWFQWWAFALYSLGLLLAGRYYVKFRINRERIRAEIRIKQVEVVKMQELDHMKSRFFANISHEFRTPLTLLAGPIDDLLKNSAYLKENDRSLLGIMKRNALRLQQLINQLLDLSRLETGNLKLEVAEGDLTGFIKAIVLSFLSLAESKKISYKYDLEESYDLSFYDADKVEKIITNIISNALKFTPDGGSVAVSLHYSGGRNDKSGLRAEFRVKDTGPGIPDDEKDKIFDRFYQVSRSDSRDHEGSGIGLALVREMVDLYRGEITMESDVGKGSTFTVLLPVSREQFRDDEIISVTGTSLEIKSYADHERTVKETAGNDLQEGQGREKVKPLVLIVEDNEDLRKYISGNLNAMYQILEAGDGAEGLSRAVENIPDLVISDLMMPGMNGLELCDRLKKDTRTNHIPLIILTAKADRESKLGSLEAGADDYIIKPFDGEELLVRVKNLIEQRKKLRERYWKEFVGCPAGIEMPAPEDEFMVRFMNCISKHLGDPGLSVEQIGRELHMSRVQLYRKVISLTDHTPSEFIRNIRLRTAARMFLEGHTNITHVLYSVGYNTPSHFTQSFHEMFGMNPSDYIRQNSPSKK